MTYGYTPARPRRAVCDLVPVGKPTPVGKLSSATREAARKRKKAARKRKKGGRS